MRIASEPGYFETQSRVAAIAARLESFVAGRESAESLSNWASALWADGGSEKGPVPSNRVATHALIDMMNASVSVGGAPAYRAVDASTCLQELRRGPDVPLGQNLATSAIRVDEVATRLALKSRRSVLDGLGWQAAVKFASLATGRAFAAHQSLEESAGPAAPLSFVCREGEDIHDALIDLVETLACDLADLDWVHPIAAVDRLPKWVLMRQDDHGVVVEVEAYSGRRKAEAALRHFDALTHKQTYWVVAAPGGRLSRTGLIRYA